MDDYITAGQAGFLIGGAKTFWGEPFAGAISNPNGRISVAGENHFEEPFVGAISNPPLL
jgi:hypothetical protein